MSETFISLIVAMIVSGILIAVGVSAGASIIQGPFLLGGFVGVIASGFGMFKKATG